MHEPIVNTTSLEVRTTKMSEHPKPLKRGTACLRCKKHKMRCDAKRPACTRCSAGPCIAECVYEQTYPRRSIVSALRSDAMESGTSTANRQDYSGLQENSRVPPTAFAATEANRRPVASAPRPQPGFPGPGPSSSGHASIQPFRNPTAPSTPTPFSPNTQAILSEFVNLPTPLFETTYDFSGSDTQNGESHGGYSDMKVDASSMSTRPSTSSAAFNGGPDTIAADVYNQFASTFQPSGYGLWDMSGFIHQSANWEAFQAMAPPAFGPPLEALQESGTEPPIAPIPLTKQASKAPPVPSASASDALTETSDPLHRLFLPVPTTSSAQDTKVIDVPPFLRQKLVQSYCYNAKRFPTIHFNRLKFRDRLLLGLESDLHPAFVYSSYLMGATLHDEPTVRDFQDNFFEIAKSEFYRGMAAGTHHLDLIRAATDMMIYLLMQGRGEAVVFGNQAAMLARFCGLHLTDDSQPPAAERRRLMYNVQAMTNQERVERLHLFWSLWSLHCCSILAWQRISAYDDQKDFAIAFNEVSGYITFQEFLEGADIGLESAPEASGAPHLLALAMTTYAFELSLSTPASIGNKLDLAWDAIRRIKASLPPAWADFAQYSSFSETSATPEKFVLLCLFSLLELAQAYLHRAAGPTSIGKSIEHVRRVVSFIGILKTDEETERVPMLAQIYWSHAISLLLEEARRLLEAGAEGELQQIQAEISIARRAFDTVQCAYSPRATKR